MVTAEDGRKNRDYYHYRELPIRGSRSTSFTAKERLGLAYGDERVNYRRGLYANEWLGLWTALGSTAFRLFEREAELQFDYMEQLTVARFVITGSSSSSAEFENRNYSAKANANLAVQRTGGRPSAGERTRWEQFAHPQVVRTEANLKAHFDKLLTRGRGTKEATETDENDFIFGRAGFFLLRSPFEHIGMGNALARSVSAAGTTASRWKAFVGGGSDEENAAKAHEHFARAIALDPVFATAAYYGQALLVLQGWYPKGPQTRGAATPLPLNPARTNGRRHPTADRLPPGTLKPKLDALRLFYKTAESLSYEKVVLDVMMQIILHESPGGATTPSSVSEYRAVAGNPNRSGDHLGTGLGEAESRRYNYHRYLLTLQSRQSVLGNFLNNLKRNITAIEKSLRNFDLRGTGAQRMFLVSTQENKVAEETVLARRYRGLSRRGQATFVGQLKELLAGLGKFVEYRRRVVAFQNSLKKRNNSREADDARIAMAKAHEEFRSEAKNGDELPLVAVGPSVAKKETKTGEPPRPRGSHFVTMNPRYAMKGPDGKQLVISQLLWRHQWALGGGRPQVDDEPLGGRWEQL